MVQAIAFVMLLAGRIDQRILSAEKIVRKSSKDLVRPMSALKLYDNGKSWNICNVKKSTLIKLKSLTFLMILIINVCDDLWFSS